MHNNDHTAGCPLGHRCESCGREAADLDIRIVDVDDRPLCLTMCSRCRRYDGPLPIAPSTAHRLADQHRAHRLAGEALRTAGAASAEDRALVEALWAASAAVVAVPAAASGRVHATYVETRQAPSRWAPAVSCHADEAEAREFVRAVTRLAGPDAAARRTWTTTPCPGRCGPC